MSQLTIHQIIIVPLSIFLVEVLEDEGKKVEQKEPRPRPQSSSPLVREEEAAAAVPKRKIVNKVCITFNSSKNSSNIRAKHEFFGLGVIFIQGEASPRGPGLG